MSANSKAKRNTVSAAMESALQHHQAGRFAEAEKLYRRILVQEPRYAPALHYLGVLTAQTGGMERAAELVGEAVMLDPNNSEARYDLALVLQSAGRLDEACVSYREAIRLDPRRFDSYNNLGVILQSLGRLEEAIAAFRAACEIEPRNALVCSNLGSVFNSYGIVLQKSGRIDEAIECFSRATTLQPHSVLVWCNYADVLQAKGRFDEAIAACREALRIDPGHAPGANKLGTALRMRGRISEAMDAFRRAVELDPALPEAQHNLGNAHRDQGEPDLAIESYRKAVALDPGQPTYHSTLAYALCFHPDYDAKAVLEEHLRWDERHAQPLKSGLGSYANEATSDRPIRIGYVSPNFRDHVVGRNILPLLREHDRADFETYCYADVANPDSFTAQFRALSSHWRDIRLVKDAQVAELVRADRIDILVDLTLHMAGSRLLVFARKPAPIQVTFAGYPGGTGMETMDYRLTDPWLDPLGVSDGDYREESIRLPQSFWCYDREAMMQGLEPEPAVGPLPALQNGVVTFGCLNVFSKLNEPLLRLWGEILRGAKNSRLLLLASEGYPRSLTLEILGHEGIDAARVCFAAPRPRIEYFRLYEEVDVSLDTLPYNGHTTGLDSFWMGVPVVTMLGRTAAGRAGYSHLSNLGLSELSARDAKEYVEIAVSLAHDLPRMSELRRTLRNRMLESHLADAKGFARAIEAAYRQMWFLWFEQRSTR